MARNYGKPTGSNWVIAMKIFSKTKMTASGCMEWQGSRHYFGYGWIRIAGKTVTTHRAVWEGVVGPIPPELVVAHKCDNPSCVRPTHLELITAAQNHRDKVTRGRDPNASKTHCKRGHPLTPDNVRIHKTSRQCKTCKTAYDAARPARRSK